VAVVATVLLLGACGGEGDGSGVSGTTSGSGGTAAGPTTSLDLAARVERFTVDSARHLTGPIQYPQTPPVGGDHNPAWINCGFYSQALPPEGAVHSLEHGAVWITFRPSLPRAQVDRIRALARSDNHVLASPWIDESLPAPVVASAWGLQLKADSADDPGVAAFVRAYANGPQTPEKGARCSGAVGDPE